jgi:hypothetical protein
LVDEVYDLHNIDISDLLNTKEKKPVMEEVKPPVEKPKFIFQM